MGAQGKPEQGAVLGFASWPDGFPQFLIFCNLFYSHPLGLGFLGHSKLAMSRGEQNRL